MPTLLEHEAKELLTRYGIATTLARLAADAETAAAYARACGGPVALKVASSDIVHKSRAGCVRLNVAAETVPGAFREILDAASTIDGARVEGVIVEPMAAPGTEVIVGATNDALFGPVVMFGLGGTDVEARREVGFRLAPLRETDARALVHDILGPDPNVEALVQVLLAVGGPDGLLFREAVEELDINPLIVNGNDVVAVDAHIVTSADRRVDARWFGILDDDEFLSLKRETYEALRPTFLPEGIVVVGASTKPGKLGFRIIQNLADFGYPGRLYAVHPSANSIYGCPAFPSVAELPQAVDRAIVAVPAATVPETLRACAGKGVKVAQVYSAGFSEWSDEGWDLEHAIKEVVQSTGIRVIGPNTIGTYCPAGGVTMSTPRHASRDPGTISVISQSGTYAIDVIRRSMILGLPLGKCVSCGNCVDIDPVDYLLFCAADPDTEVIAMYLETVKDAGRFFRLAQRIDKPLVLFKGGRTEAGYRAASSHTGAMASDLGLWMSGARQAGAALVGSIEELLDVLLGLTAGGPIHGRRLALFGSGGGVSVASSDVAASHGLDLVEFSGATRERLTKFAGPGNSVNNPIDIPVWGLRMDQRFIFHEVIDVLARDLGVDSVITYVEMNSIFEFSNDEAAGLTQMDSIIESILRTRTGGVPVSAVLRTSGDKLQDDYVRAARFRLLERGIAVYPTTARAIRAHAHLADLGGTAAPAP